MSIYDSLNSQQKEAVYCTEGPLLILAGAGSGKTRVLTHRIAYLIEERGVNPWHIMAITFTNKAASEMRERVDKLVGYGSESIWVSTFHSACVRILRRYADHIGYETNFTIYDTEDQKTLIKDICKELAIDTKVLKEKSIMAKISHAKEEYIGPEEFEKEAGNDYKAKKIAKVYHSYQSHLKKNNAMDFDDLLVKTVELFEKNPEILNSYQERFQYIMVDEYQDTNHVQFRFVSLLASKYKNLCVVGDDDQSIYKFRGADITNILEFEKFFPGTKVIRLEQNYRSTQNILNAANGVIRNNENRKEKTLWTENEEGRQIRVRGFQNGFEEAEFVIGDLQRKQRNGEFDYRDCAILYRTNAQSRLFEEKLLYANIPYKIVGGIGFYARKEIKDLICYLKTIDNARDDIAVKRIINVPKRGIGATTISRVQEYADQKGISFYHALLEAEEIPGIGRSVNKLGSFVMFIQALRSKVSEYTVRELLEDVIEKTGYVAELRLEDTEEARARIENIDELVSKTEIYQENCKEKGEEGSLSHFLEEIALIAEIDSVDMGQDYVILMTLHSAKGLEFPNVYLAGMEDGLFPSYMSVISDDSTDLEEERRLCYVGITRAMKELTMTFARQRMVRGEIQMAKTSRFIKEIPRDLVELEHEEKGKVQPKQSTFSQGISSFFGVGAQISKREAPNKIFQMQDFKVKKPESLDYEIGDTVRHVKFGVGIVKNIVDGGRDFEVTVDFERVGIKKMFAGFAKLKKI